MKKSQRIIVIVILMYLVLGVVLVFNFSVLENKNYLSLVILGLSLIISIAIYYYFNVFHKSITDDIETNLKGSMSEALKESEMGILVYNEDFEITWMSSFFGVKQIDKRGEKILVWLPELQDLLSGKEDKAIIVINDDKYEVTKKIDSHVLFFNDISLEYDLNQKVKDNAYVLGIVNFDNFDELSLNEDDVSFVNTNIKVPVIDYFRQYGIVYKTLRNNRIQLILNNRIFNELIDDRFSILNKVRREAKAGDVDVTLSMALAYGSDDLSELDEEASNLLEIAQTRGGDQVVVRQIGKEAIYYGGSSEAKERASRVKVRVVANTLKNILSSSDEVIIVGHKDADADCIGSALAISLICKSANKKTYIVTRSGGIEPMIKDVMNKYSDVLTSRHNFISEAEALNIMDDKTLVIMVDHHSKKVSNGANLLGEAKNIVIIDHHRRAADLDVDAKFLYIEAGASSATELAVELFPYFARNIDITKEEANIMYIGILIDTNHFKNRSESRTFDVIKSLKSLGANANDCEKLTQEPFEMSQKRNKIISSAKRFKDNILIAYMGDNIYPRSIASQAVDSMVEIKEINAAFVLCKTSRDECLISARSDGKINVQAIIEKMGGGGHMTAAGLQSKDETLEELYNKLVNVLNKYLESVKEDESNIA